MRNFSLTKLERETNEMGGRRGNFEIDELALRRMRGYVSSPYSHSLTLLTRLIPCRFTNSDLTRYSPDPSMPFSDLHEDLFVPQWVREQVAELRGEGGAEGEGADVRG